MKRILTLLTLLSSVAYGQIDTTETNRECEQYNIIINFIKTDTSSIGYHDVQKIRLKIAAEVHNSGLFTFTNYDLISFDTGIPRNDLLAMDKDSLQTIWTKYEEEEKSDTTKYSSHCLNSLTKEKKPNVSLWFARYSKDIVIAHTRKIHKKPRHSKGSIYIFKFEEDNFFTLQKSSYIE